MDHMEEEALMEEEAHITEEDRIMEEDHIMEEDRILVDHLIMDHHHIILHLHHHRMDHLMDHHRIMEEEDMTLMHLQVIAVVIRFKNMVTLNILLKLNIYFVSNKRNNFIVLNELWKY